MRIEVLEDRAVPATLVHSLYPDTDNPQGNGGFGKAVAADANHRVVAASTRFDAAGSAGQVFVYDGTSDSVVATINNPAPSSGDSFGSTIAVSGNYIIVGANGNDTGATDSGIAYIFDATTGSLIATLNNPAPTATDRFGFSVSISGNVAVVGAYLDDAGATDSGTVYVFNATTGSLIATLNNPTPAVSDCFGYSVGASGTNILVGAHDDDTTASNAGVAYLFSTLGSLIATLNNPAPAAGDEFGNAVAISGNFAVVGAHSDNAGANNAGSAYIFNATTGAFVATLSNPNPQIGDNFGVAVAVADGVAVVGAEQDDVGAVNGGSAFAFNASTGTLQATFENPTPETNDTFGSAVAIADGKIVVGAIFDDSLAPFAGAAYAYDATTGSQIGELTNPSLTRGDAFGFLVALNGSKAASFAWLDDTGSTDAGRGYVFDSSSGSKLSTLNDPTPTTQDLFSRALSVSGNLAVAGAYADDTGATDAGTVYVYDAPTGAIVRAIHNPTPAAQDFFGQDAAIEGTLVAIGAPGYDTGATNAGCAYLFDASTGMLLRTINNPSPATNDNFGNSVAISGNRIVVAARLDDAGATDAGIAYVFDVSTGALVATLNNPAPAVNDQFGYTVEISGNRVVVGAYLDDANATDSGSAYVFDANTGALISQLNNPTPAANDRFGLAVSIFAGTVVVGAYQDDTTGVDSGAAYVYNANAGALLETIDNPTPATLDYFGCAVAVWQNSILVGAYGDDTAYFDEGAAYLYTVPVTADRIGPVTPDPRNTPVLNVTVTLNATVDLATLTTADFTLTRDGGSNLLTGAETVTYASGTSYQLNGLSSLTALPGTYMLSLNMAGVDDLSGRPGTGVATDAWVMDVSAPRIVGVYFDGVAWDPAFRLAAGNGAYGYSAQTGASQLIALPWSNINSFAIQFNENVDVQQIDLGIRGLNVANYAVSSFSYDNVNFVARWNLAADIDTDRLILDLDGDSGAAVADLAGNQLAGTWTEGVGTFPTTGAAGSDFRFRFVVAVGDADRNGVVRNLDTNLVRANLFIDAGQAGYNIYADIDGNSQTRNADLNAVRSHLFIDPPAGPGPNRPVRGGTGESRDQRVGLRGDGYVASRLIDARRTDVKLRSVRAIATVNALDWLFTEE